VKKNLPVTDNENDYSSHMRIVSTTDLKGITTYVNDDFKSISGFSEEDLIGKSHNIVRHPDMPPAAFANLWDTIKIGKPWMGMVKNRCKNGDYYWVDAFVTPMMDGDTITGYQSVRMKPEKKHVDRADIFYKTLWKPASVWKKLLSACQFGLMGKIVLSVLATILSGLFVLLWMGHTLDTGMLVATAAMLLSGIVAAQRIAAPWKKAAAESRAVFDNGVARTVYCGRNDELGQLQSVIQMQRAQQETVVWRIGDATGQLGQATERTAEVTLKTEDEMNRQMSEVEQVASAMNEMTATVHEVAQNAALTADSTQKADEEVELGRQVVSKTVSRINQLAAEVEQAVSVIDQLVENSSQIGGVIDVIKSVAEQTNLLALNAAIEAARAGEQGRGFAVVADEVRTLAGRTQTSTQEIQTIVEALQASAADAASVMDRGQQMARESVEQASNAGESLDSISQAVSTITDMSAQIATAAEEQSSVSEEINRNIINISEASEQTLQATHESSEANTHLIQEVQRLKTMVLQFGLT